MIGFEAEAASYHHRLDGVIEEGRYQPVFDARHKEGLVDEAILRPTHALQGLTLLSFLLLGELVDDQDLEIGPLMDAVPLIVVVAAILFALFVFSTLRSTTVTVAEQLADHGGDHLGEIGMALLDEKLA